MGNSQMFYMLPNVKIDISLHYILNQPCLFARKCWAWLKTMKLQTTMMRDFSDLKFISWHKIMQSIICSVAASPPDQIQW